MAWKFSRRARTCVVLRRDLLPAASITFAGWFNPDTVPRSSAMVLGSFRSPEGFHALQVKRGGLKGCDYLVTAMTQKGFQHPDVAITGVGESVVGKGYPITRGGWHHVVASWGFPATRLCIDGGLFRFCEAAPVPLEVAKVGWGCRIGLLGSEHFDGLLDQAVFWFDYIPEKAECEMMAEGYSPKEVCARPPDLALSPAVDSSLDWAPCLTAEAAPYRELPPPPLPPPKRKGKGGVMGRLFRKG